MTTRHPAKGSRPQIVPGKRQGRSAALGLLLTLTLGTASAQTPRPKIILVTPDQIGVNDFLKGGRTGTQNVAKALGGDARVYESSDPATRRQNVEAAAREGASVVVVLGFEFADIIPDIAPRYRNTKFLIVDTCVDKPAPNVYCVVFRAQEAAFLAGVEAALTSASNKVGAIGALDLPLIHEFTDGFAQGARAARASVGVSNTVFVGGDSPFADPVRAQQQALTVLASGADRIMSAAAGGNGGVFKAVKDRPGTLAIGVDVNQCPQAPGAVLDNVEKRVDVAIVRTVTGILRGKQAQTSSLGLKEGGMTLTGLRDGTPGSQCEIAKYPKVLALTKVFRARIVSGKIKVVDPMNSGK